MKSLWRTSVPLFPKELSSKIACISLHFAAFRFNLRQDLPGKYWRSSPVLPMCLGGRVRHPFLEVTFKWRHFGKMCGVFKDKHGKDRLCRSFGMMRSSAGAQGQRADAEHHWPLHCQGARAQWLICRMLDRQVAEDLKLESIDVYYNPNVPRL